MSQEKFSLTKFLQKHEPRWRELIPAKEFDNNFGSAAKVKGDQGELTTHGLVAELLFDIDFTGASLNTGSTGTLEADAAEKALSNLKLSFKSEEMSQSIDVITGDPQVMKHAQRAAKGIGSFSNGNFRYTLPPAFMLPAGIASTFNFEMTVRDISELQSAGGDYTQLAGATYSVYANVYDLEKSDLRSLGLNNNLSFQVNEITNVTAGTTKTIKHDNGELYRKEAFLSYDEGSSPQARDHVDQFDSLVLAYDGADREKLTPRDFRLNYEEKVKSTPADGIVVREYPNLPYVTSSSKWKMEPSAAFTESTGSAKFYRYWEEIL